MTHFFWFVCWFIFAILFIYVDGFFIFSHMDLKPGMALLSRTFLNNNISWQVELSEQEN